VALAPAAALNAILPSVISLGDLSDQAYAVWALVGLSTVDPTVDLDRLLGPGARSRLPITLETGCIDQADAAFREVPTARLFAVSPAQEAHLSAELDRYGDPDRAAVRGPVLVIQGTADQDVPAGVTASVVSRLRQRGSSVVEQVYPGFDHDGVVGPSVCAQLDWFAAHGGIPVHHCVARATDRS
jgi:hypothetical protein